MRTPLPPDARPSHVEKPRVMLVDDHAGMLERASKLLAGDFEIAGTATSGTQALTIAAGVAPDVIVLDINMPELDGFRTCRALRQQGVEAPIVFLSIADDSDHIAEAFVSGGRGYVVKTQMTRDLSCAIEHVLQGRLFVPSLTTMYGCAPLGTHAMHLYHREDAFLDELAGVFDQALRHGGATCVISNDNIRAGLSARLHERGWPVVSSPDSRYLVLDTDDIVQRVMRDGLPDVAVVRDIANELDRYRLDAAKDPAAGLTLFGDVTSALIVKGHAAAAIAIESMWDTLTKPLPFFTLCGFSSSSLNNDTGLWPHVYGAHAAVSHSRDL